MTANPKVSVIVPVYNADKYLPRCLDSILSQTLRNIEILAIDDGSTDSSPGILDRYASEDERVKVFHIQNGGVSRARNLGLDNACGDFVGFVDSDDMIDTGMYSLLIQVAERDQSDCVQCRYDIVYDDSTITNGKELPLDICESNKIEGTEKIVEALFDGRLDNSICNKIYRRNTICNQRLDENLAFAEDFKFNASIMFEYNTASIIDVTFYHYIMHGESLSHNVISDEQIKGFSVYDFVKSRLSDPDVIRTVSEREVSESLRFLDSSINHPEVSEENLKMLISKVKEGRKYIVANRFMGQLEKMQARILCVFPKLYVFMIKVYKRLR